MVLAAIGRAAAKPKVFILGQVTIGVVMASVYTIPYNKGSSLKQNSTKRENSAGAEASLEA